MGQKTDVASRDATTLQCRGAAESQSRGEATLGFVDNRPLPTAQRILIERNNTPSNNRYGFLNKPAQRVEDEELLQGKLDTVQRAGIEEEAPVQGKRLNDTSATQLQAQTTSPENKTGMPDSLKSGIESLSGMDMSDVRVQRNSSKPAQLNAHAYAQGNDIHLGPGQEKHLGHEAWHVVQQRQGRVKPTMQMAGTQINDDASLEKEADVMGGRALAQRKVNTNKVNASSGNASKGNGIAQRNTDAESGAMDNPGAELKKLVGLLAGMLDSAIAQGAKEAGIAGLDEFRSKQERLKEISSGNDSELQTQAVVALQKELTQAGVPLGGMSEIAESSETAVQKKASMPPVQRLTGVEVAAIATTVVVGVGTLAYAIFRFCRGPQAAPAIGYAANPIPITAAGNILQIAEFERGQGAAVAFTAISSCLGVFHRNGAAIHAVHLPFLDAAGQLVSGVAGAVLVATATGAVGNGGTFYFVGERDVWLGSGANAQYAALNAAFGGVHSRFGSGNYSASIDPVTDETVIQLNGHEVLRGN
ncbi:DUF4157 domain-containing protein [Pseudomonadota bacterium]